MGMSLVVLGCYLDGSGSTETQVKGRLGQGRKMFGKLRPVLCCPRIPEEERCMLGGRKAQDVPWVDWFRMTKRSAHTLRCKLNLPSLLPSWACCNSVAKR